jgi:hypothetical protein
MPTVNRSNRDSFLEKCAVNVQHSGNRNHVDTDFDLGQLKGYRSIRITSKQSVSMGILILVKCKVLVTGQRRITNQSAQHLFCRPRAKLQYLCQFCGPSPSLCTLLIFKSPLRPSMAARRRCRMSVSTSSELNSGFSRHFLSDLRLLRL